MDIWSEHFWSTLKYEHIYLHPSEDGLGLFMRTREYIQFYNQTRRHKSLNLLTPQESFGSLAQNSSLVNTPIFKTILTAHIIGAILTFIIWGYTVFASSKKYKNALPGKFSITHRNLGWMIIIGLLYTGISALMVFLMLYDLV